MRGTPAQRKRRWLPGACLLAVWLAVGTSASLTAFLSGPMPVKTERMHVPLLGGNVSWLFGKWSAVTDAVRGGVSTAALEPAGAEAAQFRGSLDPSVLGAGFAGVRSNR